MMRLAILYGKIVDMNYICHSHKHALHPNPISHSHSNNSQTALTCKNWQTEPIIVEFLKKRKFHGREFLICPQGFLLNFYLSGLITGPCRVVNTNSTYNFKLGRRDSKKKKKGNYLSYSAYVRNFIE